MLVFLDFEASSLGKHSYPIEVAWIFADGRSETHLIRPAPAWIDWDEEAQAIHGITRETLALHGTPHDLIAQRMIDQLTGHDLLASAPSWDGKWLSALLRAAGYPRHSLRLRRTAEALRECAWSILAPKLADEDVVAAIEAILTRHENGASGEAPAHRALPDAQADRARWLAVCDAAREVAAAKVGDP
ncbi:3'-5' exonuclease [Sphingomonas sp. OTU376]|uniref:3'-5' exonuclease n=1 Tax=Sphingomonas sp. OTU376 TaxID=3043863 RepID=UPI00313AF424